MLHRKQEIKEAITSRAILRAAWGKRGRRVATWRMVSEGMNAVRVPPSVLDESKGWGSLLVDKTLKASADHR